MGQVRLNFYPAHLRGMPQFMKANKPLHPIHIGPFRRKRSMPQPHLSTQPVQDSLAPADASKFVSSAPPPLEVPASRGFRRLA